jgi:dolichyl-phosphate beta-glucosyltransferase
MSAPELSVVIPAFNEATRLPTTLDRVLGYLERGTNAWEILVVDDGSSDATAEVAAAREDTRLRVLRNESNRGKGYSVRRGMLEARGARRLMTDADLSTPIEEVERLAAALDAGADVAIASRAHPESRIERHQPAYRECVGRAFNLLVRLTLLPGLHDTQCGFKLFSAAAAEAAFAGALLDGFAFDVEALFLARSHGFVVTELPTVWRNDEATRVTTWRGMLAFADVLRVRFNAWRGLYGASSGT